MIYNVKIENLPAIRDVPSKNQCNYLAEGAAVCLHSLNHQIGCTLKILGHFKGDFKLTWNPVTPFVAISWDDKLEATEAGASCIALWIIEKLTNLKVVRRSFQGTGFDYWLGEKDTKFPFVSVARLEVSGILNDKTARVNQRLREKTLQVKKSNHLNLPAYIIVVEFGQLIAKTKMV